MAVPRCLLVVLGAALAAWAAPALADAGTITHLAGTLSVKKADGSVRILSVQSQVENGDTLSTQQETYAEIKFVDGARVTLKPNSSVKIDNVQFVHDQPKEDSFIYSLLRGGLRAVTGLVGKRSKESYELKTETATIGVRGTVFNADDCIHDRESPDCKRLDPAVYVSVAEGEIVLRNAQGTLQINTGQFGFIPPNQPPIFLQINPGLHFNPPATFSRAGASSLLGSDGPKFMCAVR